MLKSELGRLKKVTKREFIETIQDKTEIDKIISHLIFSEVEEIDTRSLA